MRDFFCTSCVVLDPCGVVCDSILSIKSQPDGTMQINAPVSESGEGLKDFLGNQKSIDIWNGGHERVLHLLVEFDSYELLPYTCAGYAEHVEEAVRLKRCKYTRRYVPWSDVPPHVRKAFDQGADRPAGDRDMWSR